MTIKVRPYRGQKTTYEVDIQIELPSGVRIRERVKSPVGSKSGSQRWAEARVREMLDQKPAPARQAPRLADHQDQYIELCRSERQKESTILFKQGVFRNWLIPHLGEYRLHEISNPEIAKLKQALRKLTPKGANNVLNVLSTVLQTAIDPLDLMDAMPCRIKLLRTTTTERPFWEIDEYERLVSAAPDERTRLVILLGGDAGLRAGEIVALEQRDIDYRRGSIAVQRNEYRGHVGTPKGGRSRRVHMTGRLAAALRKYRHAGDRVFEHATQKVMARWVGSAERAAGLSVVRGLHRLRHTFCSHLAMQGAPARAIQELAGHADLKTTLLYMHLSPTATSQAIQLLGRGEILETAPN